MSDSIKLIQEQCVFASLCEFRYDENSPLMKGCMYFMGDGIAFFVDDEESKVFEITGITPVSAQTDL